MCGRWGKVYKKRVDQLNKYKRYMLQIIRNEEENARRRRNNMTRSPV
jgi:hypothetical protein